MEQGQKSKLGERRNPKPGMKFMRGIASVSTVYPVYPCTRTIVFFLHILVYYIDTLRCLLAKLPGIHTWYPLLVKLPGTWYS